MWKLDYLGTVKSFSEWGLGGLRRSLTSAAPDSVSFVADAKLFDSNAAFAYGGIVRVLKDETQWFYGRVVKTPRAGAFGAESLSYEVAGPWWWLENLVFEQEYQLATGYDEESGEYTFTTFHTSHVFLNKYDTVTGVRTNNGQQITEAVNWAISHGAPIQIGTISVDVEVVTDEQKDITCAEVIKKMLRWSPDAVAYFDYSTLPYPTFHVKKRSELVDVAVDISDGVLVDTINIIERKDMVVPHVYLKFERKHSFPNSERLEIVEQKFPNPEDKEPQFGALVATIDLVGASFGGTETAIVTQPIPSMSAPSEDNKQWWIDRTDWLQDEGIDPDSIVITPVERSLEDEDENPLDASLFPNELVEGQIADWMEFNANRETLKAKVVFKLKNGSVKQDRILSATINSTNATTGVYRDSSNDLLAEPIPDGLAEDLYNALSEPQFDGSLSFTEKDVGGIVGMGNSLNLTGTAQASWATMRAMIVGVTENVDSGVTNISFGPKKLLGVSDLVEILRATRSRRLVNPISIQSGASISKGRQVVLGKKLTRRDSQSGSGRDSTHTVSVDSDPEAKASASPDSEEVGKITHEVKGKDSSESSPKVPMTVRTVWSGKPVASTSTPESPRNGKVEINISHTEVDEVIDGETVKTAKEVRLRELRYCEDGERKAIVVLCSEPYTPPEE